MGLTQVSTDGVKNDAITKTKIPANQIEASELADNAVDTAAIADDAVTQAKLATNSVGSQEIIPNNVVTTSIADDAVTDAKLANSINSAIAANTAKVQTTINNNADNRVITGSGTANTLEGEASLTFSAGLLKIDDHAGNAGNGRLEFGNSGEQFIEGYDTGNAGSSSFLKFGDGSTERMRIQSGGGISFNGDTAAANALDDYEEGTFTPSFANVDNSVITVNHYHYTKVGRLVHINAKFTIGSNNDGSAFGFQLPFTQAGSRENVISAISTRSGSNTAPFAFVINANQSYAYGQELDGFGNSQTAYATFAGAIILVTGTFESN